MALIFSEAFSIHKGITAVIGSGGKTSLIRKLSEELSEIGTVLICTTTKIYPPEGIPYDEGRELSALRKLLEKNRTAAAGRMTPEGKLRSPALPVSELRKCADYILCEADGSRHMLLKAHRPSEPVIPEGSVPVILVAAAAGIGQPLGTVCHCPEIFQEIAEKVTGFRPALTDPVTPELLAAVINAENLGDFSYWNLSGDEIEYEKVRQIAPLLKKPVFYGRIPENRIFRWKPES